jgi:predicted ribosome quality control (RQC) complex YloA/Tae2 family protein
MALDGIVLANICCELNSTLKGGRLYKIAQPESDELLLTIKTSDGQYRLVLSANASLPLVYLTDENKPSPMTAPNFCMLLRKHLNNGRIVAVTQPGLERIVDIEIEHLNEMGDLCRKHLITEIMGKHSNIIFCDGNTIIDSIKHVSAQMSSVREVLPGREYFIPNTTDKLNPLSTSFEEFKSNALAKPVNLQNALSRTYTGISSVSALQIVTDASLDADMVANCLNENESLHLYKTFENTMDSIKSGDFCPNMAYEKGVPAEFASIKLTNFEKSVEYDSVSSLVRDYYSKKDSITRMHQKSSDLRRIVSTALERARKKEDIQSRQIKDTLDRDKYRVYGELINTYGYNVTPKSKSFTALNYYTNEEITIPLDPDLTPSENAVRYFNRYNKLKRTYEATTVQLNETCEEIEHLESIATALDIAVSEDDLAQVKLELTDSGYIRKNASTGKKAKITSKPFHYISSDGFDIYVGKNNYQNDELTFKFAKGDDFWFHAKKMAGSHVILKTQGKSQNEIPDRAFEEAASLAAYYSKGQSQEKVEIDYVIKKEVKKPAAAKPGFVVYYTNYSMVASTDISQLKQCDQ